MIDAERLDAIAETVADEVVEIVEAMGLKPKKGKEVAEGKLSDETILEIYDRMPQEIRDFLRGHWGDEVWTQYETYIDRIRGG